MKFLILLLPIILNANTAPTKQTRPKKDFQFSVASFFSSKIVYRGALIWNSPVMGVGPGLTIYDTITLGRGGLSLKKVFGEHKLQFGSEMFRDRPGFPLIKLKNKDLDYKNTREATWGLYLSHEYKKKFDKKFIKFKSSFHKDLNEHDGNYFNFDVSTSLIPLISFGLAGGFGDLKHNQYVYGSGAVDGLAHIDYRVGVFIPFLPLGGIMIMNYTRSQIALEENVQSSFIRGKKNNSKYSVVAIWSL